MNYFRLYHGFLGKEQPSLEFVVQARTLEDAVELANVQVGKLRDLYMGNVNLLGRVTLRIAFNAEITESQVLEWSRDGLHYVSIDNAPRRLDATPCPPTA
jgi:hypothetical protein